MPVASTALRARLVQDRAGAVLLVVVAAAGRGAAGVDEACRSTQGMS